MILSMMRDGELRLFEVDDADAAVTEFGRLRFKTNGIEAEQLARVSLDLVKLLGFDGLVQLDEQAQAKRSKPKALPAASPALDDVQPLRLRTDRGAGSVALLQALFDDEPQTIEQLGRRFNVTSKAMSDRLTRLRNRGHVRYGVDGFELTANARASIAQHGLPKIGRRAWSALVPNVLLDGPKTRAQLVEALRVQRDDLQPLDTSLYHLVKSGAIVRDADSKLYSLPTTADDGP